MIDEHFEQFKFLKRNKQLLKLNVLFTYNNFFKYFKYF